MDQRQLVKQDLHRRRMSLPINIPSRIVKDQAITAAWANQVREAIARLASVKPKKSFGGGGGSKPNPFDVTLIVGGTTEAPTYKVSVADGWVNERIPGVQDPPVNATAVHKPWNILWGTDAVAPDLGTDRRTFPISIGQQVSVIVNVAAEGNIELPAGAPGTTLGPTEIAVEAEDEDSVHYVPPRPVDSDTGSAGVYHYKLAVLRAADATHSTPWLEIFLAGSHIDHFAELPILDNLTGAAEDIGRVFKEYDPETNTYTFRAIDTSEGELVVTETEDGLGLRGNSKDGTLTITIDGESPVTALTWVDGLVDQEGTTDIAIPAQEEFPGGANLDLQIFQATYNANGEIYSETSTPIQTLFWRNGLFIGETQPTDPEGTTVITGICHKLLSQA